MNLKTSPKVYVLSRPSVDYHAISAFLADENLEWSRTASSPPADELVEVAGRVCYMSFGNRQSPKTNTEYISNLVRLGHESVLEHVSWTLLITGVSRAFTHQLVRHRVGFSFSQLSQQYYDESDADMVIPANLSVSPAATQLWGDAVENARNAYRAILAELRSAENDGTDSEKERLRAVRSAARSILPNATETKVVMTVNARALRHFLRLRGSVMGDLEMRCVSAALLSAIKQDAPSIFADFEISECEDGFPVVRCTMERLH